MSGGLVTIGVAIAVPEPHASVLRKLRHEAGDAQAATVPPHVTFLPPSVVRRADLDEIEEHLTAVASRHQPFELRLAGAGSFRPVSQVVFAHVSEGIASCELLAADVCSGPLDIDRAFPYHPHVTVAHDVAASALDRTYAALRSFEATVRVQGFTMFEQRAVEPGTVRAEDGSSPDDRRPWRVRRVFPLGHRGAADRIRSMWETAPAGSRSTGPPA